jgi:HlyD family secretion protein
VKLRAGLLLLALAAGGVLIWALIKLKSRPPEVQFARVSRETIHSSIVTDGKVDPIELAGARAERAGPVGSIMVHRGEVVAKDQPLVEIDSADPRAGMAAAAARIAQARRDLEVIRQGGRATDRAEIASGLDRERHDLEVATKNYESLQRLEAKQAATAYEVSQAKQKVEEAQLQIHTLEDRKTALALAASGDRAAAQARLEDAEAAARLAGTQIEESLVRAPIAGTVYEFDLKPGAYLNAGDTIAMIGRMESVRVTVHVDEPDLGHVAKGMPVAITWDALPGREWTGEVDRTPTEIVKQDTRRVGEVACVIRNPDRGLLPGTNVTVEIRSQTVAGALTIPKEALRTEHGQTGVYLLNGDAIAWKPVTPGVSNTTRVQVDGLNEGDAVALFSEKPLRSGMVVEAKFP